MNNKSVSFQMHKGTLLIKSWSMDWNMLHREKKPNQPVNTMKAELQVLFLSQGSYSQTFEQRHDWILKYVV